MKRFIGNRKIMMMLFAIIIVLGSTALSSCRDDFSISNQQNLKKREVKNVALDSSLVNLSVSGGLQRPKLTRSLDDGQTATRAVTLNDNYRPVQIGSNLTTRFFLVKDNGNHKQINGEEAINPENIVMAAGEFTWDDVVETPGGGLTFNYSSKPYLTKIFWLNGKKDIKPGENWYICCIIGGEYNATYDKARKEEGANKALAEKLYHFYVDFDPNHSKDHNKLETNYIKVTAPYTTGWIKLNVKNENRIDLPSCFFSPLGTLLHFRVKRDENLVPLSACRYAFASSQLSANGGFLMMPQSSFRQGNDLNEDYDAKVNCEIRPWEKDITKNFYWNYVGDMQPHMNNVVSQTGYEEFKTNQWGDKPLYEYRYTFDAGTMRGENRQYDEFYVWGMPIPYDGYIGQTMLTAERGGYMLGRKQPKGAKYPYADEWLYAAGEPELTSGEYRVCDFKAADKKNKAYSIELGVCRPRFSEMDNGKPKYPWANPLERLAVTNSNTEGAPKTFHTDNANHTNARGNGYVKGWSLKSSDFKMRFVLNKDYLPDGYHVPSGEEWGLVLPNKVQSLESMKLYDGLLGWNNIETAPGPLYERYNPFEDDMRDRIVAGGTSNPNDDEDKDKEKKPAFLSYYMQDRSKLEMYAIRFNGNNIEAARKTGRQLPGNRYCCAYRWRMMDAEGPEKTTDHKGMRVIVQSRWIGNANVSVRDLVDDAWWGPVSHTNPLFNIDCYRILNNAGYPYKGPATDWTWFVTFWSRTRWKFLSGADDAYSNKTFCYRRFYKEGYERGHYENAWACYPVRLLCGRDQDEFGPNAPRQKQSDLFNEDLLHRKFDEGVDWTYPKKKK